jgi:hypothetical protein
MVHAGWWWSDALGVNRTMSAIYPLVLFIATGLIWALTAWQNSRLVHSFWQRLPHIAQRELPGTMDRHPEKTLFFFRRRAEEVLRGDEILWRQRKRFLFLFALSVLVPVLGFVSIGVVAYVQSHQ